jgi:hypothetical protein
VDAMDMSFQKEHINCFVVASGDSDFSPLVSKLKENNKYVIGLGVKNSTSDLLIENCDEFIFYEDLVRGQQRPFPQIGNLPEKVQECFSLLVDSILALQRENKEILWGSMVKETMKRKKPSFNETYYGFRTFSHLLEEAQRKGVVSLRRDQRSGSYIVEDLGQASGPVRPEPAPAAALSRPEPVPVTPAAPAPMALAAVSAEPAAEANGARSPRRRRSRGRGRTRTASPLAGGASPDDAAEIDDHDDGEDDLDDASPVGHDARREPSRDPEPEVTPAPAAAEPRTAENPNPEAPRTQADRPFSLFSWIRRDPGER